MARIRSLAKWLAQTSVARSLRFRLISIVLLASLPTLGLLFLTASQARSDALTNAQLEADRIASRVAAEQAQRIDRLERELALLTWLPEIRSGTPESCSDFVSTLLSADAQSVYVGVWIVDTEGVISCSSATATSFTPASDHTFIDVAIRQQVFTVGPYYFDNDTGKSYVDVAMPILETDGTVARAMVVAVDLAQQSGSLSPESLPSGSFISIVDSTGTILLQDPPDSRHRIDAEVFATPIVGDSSETGVTGPFLTMSGDDRYLVAHAVISPNTNRPGDLPAYIVVEVPKAEVTRRANSAFQNNLAKLAVAAAVAVLAAWISADLFVSRDSETRKTIVSELYHAFGTGIVEHLDTIVDENFVDNAALPGQAQGLDGLKQTIAAFRYAFPDGEVVPREMLADRDKVVVRVSLTGTMVGEFQGIAPTATRMIADGMETFAFRDGLISESWSLMGPLLEMEIVENPRILQVEPSEPRRTLFQRLRGKFGRKPRGDSA